jgi:hypothetical protein
MQTRGDVGAGDTVQYIITATRTRSSQPDENVVIGDGR